MQQQRDVHHVALDILTCPREHNGTVKQPDDLALHLDSNYGYNYVHHWLQYAAEVTTATNADLNAHHDHPFR